MKADFGKKNYNLIFGVSLLLVVSTTILSVYLVWQSQQDRYWMEHREKMEIQLEGILKSIYEMEATLRGYIITKNPDVMKPYNAAFKRQYDHVLRIDSLTPNVAEQKKNIGFLKTLIEERVGLLAFSKKISEDTLIPEKDRQAIMKMNVAKGDSVMGLMRKHIAIMSQYEMALLRKRTKSINAYDISSLISISIFGLITTVAISFGFLQIKKEATSREAVLEERLSTLRKLRESESKYSNVIQHSNDAILILDHHLIIISWNPSASLLFGYPEKEVLLQPVEKVIPSLIDILIPYSFTDTDNKASRPHTRMETLLSNYFGGNFPAEISIGNWTINNRLFICCTIRDLTELKKAEKEIVLAEQVSMSSRMARIMAHEIRNPLTNIHLAADGLSIEDNIKDNEELLSYLTIIKRNGTRINNLITEMLESTRSASLQLQEQIIEDIIADVIKDTNDRIILKNIELIRTENSSSTYLNLDTKKMKLALSNLLANAIEAMEECEMRQLKIDHSLTDHHFILKITDTGVGMDEKTMHNIFEPFFSKRSGGIGLGMTAVHNIIIQHKGNIAVNSKPGNGTTFIITLPRIIQ